MDSPLGKYASCTYETVLRLHDRADQAIQEPLNLMGFISTRPDLKVTTSTHPERQVQRQSTAGEVDPGGRPPFLLTTMFFRIVDWVHDYIEPDHMGQLNHVTSRRGLSKKDRPRPMSAQRAGQRVQVEGLADGYGTPRHITSRQPGLGGQGCATLG